MITVEQFFNVHHAFYTDIARWALIECDTMLDVWTKARPDWLVWVATRHGVLDDTTSARFRCWCARLVWHDVLSSEARAIVEAVERWILGDVIWEDVVDIVSSGVGEVIWMGHGADRAALLTAYRDRSWSVARLAAEAYGSELVAWQCQARWLRENTAPSFTATGDTA